MTVYLVTSGDYSDYRVEGVFSTEEKAAAYVEEMRRCEQFDSHEIEPWEIDELSGTTHGPRYLAIIRLDSGEFHHRGVEQGIIHPDGRCEVNGPYGAGQNLVSVSSPVSAEHAAKVAVEKRQEWLRAGGMDEMVHRK